MPTRVFDEAMLRQKQQALKVLAEVFPTDFTWNQGKLENEQVIGNQHGYAKSIQMGNQMQYAGQYVGNQMDQIVNKNVVNQNGNDCFMTSIQQPTSEIHSSDIGRNYNVNAMTMVEKIQYLLMLANKEESGIPLTAE